MRLDCLNAGASRSEKAYKTSCFSAERLSNLKVMFLEKILASIRKNLSDKKSSALVLEVRRMQIPSGRPT